MKRGNKLKKYGNECKINDIITMILDLNNLTLSYKINDKDYGIAFADIENTEYRAAFYTDLPDTEIELVHSGYIG